MKKDQLAGLSLMTLALAALTLRNALPVEAAACVDGKPTVKLLPGTQAVSDCQCFANDPPGTQIFAFVTLQVSVKTHGTEFGYSFDPDSLLTCDTEHLYVSPPAFRGSAFHRHAYPLHATTLVSGAGGEEAVLPGEHPNSHLQRLIEIGQAHLARTL